MNNKDIADQQKAIQSLRERLSDVLIAEQNEDFYLNKWLTAQKYDIDKTEEVLKKHLRFMRTHGLDKIDGDYVPNKAMEYFHTSFLGYDKEGSVVRILHVGGSDLRGLVLSLSKSDCIRHAFYVLLNDSRRQRRERENDAICHKQVYVFDLKELNWYSIIQRAVVDRTFVLLKSYEKHHPESLKCVYVINAPTFFGFIFNWIKTFLPESILSKVYLLNQDNLSQITTNIDPKILPASVGGTMVDQNGDPECASMYKKPLYGLVPEDMMLYNKLDVLENDPSATKTVIDNGGIFILENNIQEPNSILLWDFQTRDFDICFGINYKKDKESAAKVILPSHRVESHKIPESGRIICEETGIFELVFDNSYSWMTKKELLFKASVVSPAKEDHE